MKYSTIFTALLCAEAALGARWTEKRRQSREARQLSRRSSSGALRATHPKIPSDTPVEDLIIENSVNKSNVEYSSNWAGAVLIGTGYTKVTGTVVVPTLTTTSSSRTESAGSAVSS